MKTAMVVLFACVSALALAACGNRGALERPPPLWGEPQSTPAGEGGQDTQEDDERRPSQRRPVMRGDDPFDDG